MNAISLSQLAARWSCTTQTLRNMIRRGELTAFTVGRLVRVSIAEVEKRERGECRDRDQSDRAITSDESVDTGGSSGGTLRLVSPEPAARGKAIAQGLKRHSRHSSPS